MYSDFQRTKLENNLRQKKSILIEESLRRVRNVSPELSWELKMEYISRFSLEMRAAGYSEGFRKVVNDASVEKYTKLLEDHRSGSVNMTHLVLGLWWLLMVLLGFLLIILFLMCFKNYTKKGSELMKKYPS